MKLLKQKFFCFSPQVMLATFLIEMAFALYVWWKFKITNFTRTATLILVALGTFQLSEYQVCSNYYPLIWAKIGFVAIATLPTLGLHLINALTGSKRSLWWANLTATIFIAGFIFFPNAISGAFCGGNYNIFTTDPRFNIFFDIYYPGFILLALFWAFRALQETTGDKRKVLKWTIFGYLSFILPTIAIYIINISTRAGITSIMCGFALILAFILTWKIAPMTAERKTPHD